MTMTAAIPEVIRVLRNGLKRLSSSVCRLDRNCATGNSRANRIGSTRQDDRNLRAQNETGAVGVRQEAELLGEHIPGLEARHEKDVGIAGDRRLDTLDLRGFCADRVVERPWAIQAAARDLLPV